MTETLAQWDQKWERGSTVKFDHFLGTVDASVLLKPVAAESLPAETGWLTR